MKKIIPIICLALALVGCQSHQEAPDGSMKAKRQDAAKKLFAQSVLLLQQKDLKGAVASLEASIKMDPTDPNPYLLLGQILISAQQYDNAVQFLDQTAKNFPDNAAVFYMLSIASRMDGKTLPAVLAARRSFEIFKAANDAENAQRSALLVEELIKEAQAEEGKAVAAPKTKADAKSKR